MSSDDNCLFCFGTGKRNPHRYDDNAPLERAINESYRYQGLLYQAWRALRAQTKGLQRQRRLIKRLQAERTLIVTRAENAEAALVEAELEYQDARTVREQLEARLAEAEALLREIQSKVIIMPELVRRIDAHLVRKP
jgi:chromosome segregation ATPase